MFPTAPDESIWIGMLKLTLFVPRSQSLKDKRRAVARVRDRLRARHNLSVSEVGHLESRDRAVLAAVLVTNDPQHARSMLDKLAHSVDSWHGALVERRDVSVFRPEAEPFDVPEEWL